MASGKSHRKFQPISSMEDQKQAIALLKTQELGKCTDSVKRKPNETPGLSSNITEPTLTNREYSFVAFPQHPTRRMFVSEVRVELERLSSHAEDSEENDSTSFDGPDLLKSEHKILSKSASLPKVLSYKTEDDYRKDKNAKELMKNGGSAENNLGQKEISEHNSQLQESRSHPLLLTQNYDLSEVRKSGMKENSFSQGPSTPSPRPFLREHSYTSTPISKSISLEKQCHVRANLSREMAFEICEDPAEKSLSSSELSNSSISVSLDRYRDELSDDGSCGDVKMREFTDEQPELRSSLEMPVPMNRQLRIVTSVDRALNPRRRCLSMSSKSDRNIGFGRSSSENLLHIIFLDFLKKHNMSAFIPFFPPSMTMADWR